ncbi:MAG: polysulfide reductase NrfD [Thaumarchaeota archaeon]|nr:polysulfide reductase NrfD [Nitrososphaerota archaeon]MCL5316948.1 polysulfide reductase NrfD [Nitrososphaerota archaeon]
MIEGFVFPNEAEVNWSLLIVLYPYITGLVAGAFIVSALYHVFGISKLKPVARLSLLSALAFLIVAPLPLVLHLGRPERGIEILLRPNLSSSAMAGFGYIYLFYMIIVVAEIWLEFRRDIITYAKSSSGIKKLIYTLLSLGVLDLNEEAFKSDKRISKALSTIGIPSAAVLHGYVGFIFGSIKANPWWSTPLMPVIFLMSAIVSGVALLLAVYILSSKIRRVKIDTGTVATMQKWLFGFLVIDVAFEMLEIIAMRYESEETWPIINQLITEKIAVTFFGVQLIMGTFMPLAILGLMMLLKTRDSIRVPVGLLVSLMIVVGIFAMRWNVVIGGQLVSKSFKGFVEYIPEIGGREGVLSAIGVIALPFIILTVLTLILPPWIEKMKDGKDEHSKLERELVH